MPEPQPQNDYIEPPASALPPPVAPTLPPSAAPSAPAPPPDQLLPVQPPGELPPVVRTATELLPPALTPAPIPGAPELHPIPGGYEYQPPGARVAVSSNENASIQQAVRQEWLNAGYPAPAVEGIMRNTQMESGDNPFIVGDGGTSFGLYQHHADRVKKLAQFLMQNGATANDPVKTAILQTKFAISEMNGGDPGAARAKAALMNPNINPDQAFTVFRAGFERPAQPGVFGPNVAFGHFSESAQSLVNAWTKRSDEASAQFQEAIKRGEKLDDFAQAVAGKWMAESDHPPQNMRQAWGQWGGIAMALAAFAPLFARRNMTAALGAAGEMLQAANTADQHAYEISYRNWSRHLDLGLKAIDLIHNEAKDIINNGKLSYDQQLGQLDVLAKAYQVAGQLDHQTVAQIEQNLRLEKENREIIKARNEDFAVSQLDQEWLKQHPEAGGNVPAEIHTQNVGRIKREGSGTAIRAPVPREIEVTESGGKTVQRGAAYQDPEGNWRWAATNQPVTVPPGGVMNLTTTRPRSAATQYIAKFMEEHPGATSQDIARASADYARQQSIERGFATGQNANQMRQLNTLADHLRLLREYAAALQSGQVPRANAAWQRLMTELGHPEVTTYELGHILAADELVRLITATGGTEADRLDMQRALAPASASPAQIAGAIGAATDFTHSRFEALEQLYARNDPERRHEFETEMLTPAAREMFVKQRTHASQTHAVPKDLPDPTGLKEGTVARDPHSHKIVAHIHNGQWVSP